MIANHNSDLKKFLVRLGVTLAAVVLVMYLAKVWFVDQRRANLLLQEPTSEQVKTPVAESQQLTGTLRIISWQDAAKHYGEYAMVEGTIVATHNSGKACFLNFHPDYRRYFTAVIFASAFPRFPANPENYYYGKKVRVSGYIKEYEGGPEIILNDPSQIEILK
ncbi:OB-fold nucleic acid binding domain-containing protein [Candidatus Aerophobetes bacterium]|nr:OB-fold nucleic acid binding domain-containing protein [Candidatus Aerophobetes bacterium]